MLYLIVALLIILFVLFIFAFCAVVKMRKQMVSLILTNSASVEFESIKHELELIKLQVNRNDILINTINKEIHSLFEYQDKRLNDTLGRTFQNQNEQSTLRQNALMTRVDERFKSISESNATFDKSIWERLIDIDRRIEGLLNSQSELIQKNFALQRQENREQIDKIRESVNEKLDKTLNDQFERSFKGLIEQMTQLQTSMGELKGISSQVGSLEKTLNGVKTRGVLGEAQLKMLIQDILNPAQYDVEVPTFPGTNNHVEIAIKLPEKNSDGFFYLPVDSKFHIDKYYELVDAYDTGDKDIISAAKKSFKDIIIKDAKDINSKYIKEPYTTPYAILFVPSEAIYSEVVNLNLVEELNRLHITVAGPYTMMAILSTILNYWQALAIEKKSDEIEKTLSGTKKAVGDFDVLLSKVRKNVNTVSNDLEKLQTTRTNAILRALKNVSGLADSSGSNIPELLDQTSDFGEDE